MERTRGKEMADKLSMPSLTRAWQLTLKGVGEVQSAPNAVQAAQMALIRLAHAADLPAASTLVRQLTGDGAPPRPPLSPAPSAPAPSTGPRPPRLPAACPKIPPQHPPETRRPQWPPHPRAGAGRIAGTRARTRTTSLKRNCRSLNLKVVDLFRDRREMILYSQLQNNVHLVAFENLRWNFVWNRKRRVIW